MSDLTPLMKQYFDIKARYPDTILFFRMGDFYEMFGEDAVLASGILQIALTSRDKGKENPVPMCGVPYHAAEGYLSKLVQAGKRVAVCEQVEDPRQAKGLVRRDVVRVVTPGTHMPEDLPLDSSNRFILCLYPRDRISGMAWADLTTGEFRVLENTSPWEDELARLEPTEVLVPEQVTLPRMPTALSRYTVTPVPDARFQFSEATLVLEGHFGREALTSTGMDAMLMGVSAAGVLLGYLMETQKTDLSHIQTIRPVERKGRMTLDSVTQRNLELVKGQSEDSEGISLYSVLKATVTPMGSRLLRHWILNPLLSTDEIDARLDNITHLLEDPALLGSIRAGLKGIPDLERLISRVSMGLGNARDLVALSNGVSALPGVREQLSGVMGPGLGRLARRIDGLDDVRELVTNTIVDTPPHSVREGGLIRDGYSAELDELRGLSAHGRDFLASLELKERQETGIQALKVGFNRVFGYYIEVPKAKQDQVPAHYVRKQTLVSAERYITEELKRYEDKILGAEDKIKAIEYAIFVDIRDTVAEVSRRILDTAAAIAELDVLASLAQTARVRRYIRPVVTNGDGIRIVGGRHPVVEAVATSERFTPNDTELDGADHRLMIITGPNMAGKSTYMRQVALITLMAQMGSFVPAEECEIGVVDRIFTRIGASDRLAKGESTFMVEMTETSHILSHATPRSLLVLDEVGRGTSTFDGISIAWAVAEHICRNTRARTLFATHYHELTELAMVLDGVRNYNVAVKEWGEEIIFLRKIREGAADKSYGIQVGRLAGLPASVIERAKEVMGNLEKAELNEVGQPKLAQSEIFRKERGDLQLDLFTVQPDPVVVDLLGLDITRLTPIEALNKLHELQTRAGEKKHPGGNS